VTFDTLRKRVSSATMIIEILISLTISFLISLTFLRAVESRQTKYSENLLLVTAHPDDESMFFVPSLEQFAVKRLLCLSNGNYEGKGKEREKELRKAAELLGFAEVNIGEFHDGPNEMWSEQDVASFVEPFIRDNTWVLTFDELGFSGHSNHIAVYRGMQSLRNKYQNVRFMKLRSECSLLKFMGVWGGALKILLEPPLAKVFVSSNIRLVLNAMSLHQTQFVWFRILFVMFASCTYVNILLDL